MISCCSKLNSKIWYSILNWLLRPIKNAVPYSVNLFFFQCIVYCEYTITIIIYTFLLLALSKINNVNNAKRKIYSFNISSSEVILCLQIDIVTLDKCTAIIIIMIIIVIIIVIIFIIITIQDVIQTMRTGRYIHIPHEKYQ